MGSWEEEEARSSMVMGSVVIDSMPAGLMAKVQILATQLSLKEWQQALIQSVDRKS